MTEAIKVALGATCPETAIRAQGNHGPRLGAAEEFGQDHCALTIQKGIIPPTINYVTPDPECDLNYTPNVAVEKKVDVAVNINLGFGGHNGVIVLKRFAD